MAVVMQAGRNGNAVGAKICEILGLPSDKVYELNFNTPNDELITVDVKMYVKDEDEILSVVHLLKEAGVTLKLHMVTQEHLVHVETESSQSFQGNGDGVHHDR